MASCHAYRIENSFTADWFLLSCFMGSPWEVSSFLDEDWHFPMTAWQTICGGNRLFPFGCKVLFFSYSGPDFALLVPWEFITPWLKQWQPQWPSLLQATVPVIISISFISASSDSNAEKRDVNRDKVKLPLSFKNSEGQQDMLVIFDIFILKGQCLQRVAWTFV